MTYIQQLFESLKTQEGVLTPEQIQANALISLFITDQVQSHGVVAAHIAAGASLEIMTKSGFSREELHQFLDKLLDALISQEEVAKIWKSPSAP